MIRLRSSFLMQYSLTQGTNIAGFIAALGILVKIFHDPSSVTADEWQIAGIAIVGLFSTAINFINRYRKGDIKISGVRK